jgi:hypothetical protein
VPLATLPLEDQALVEQALMLAASLLWSLNPSNMEDVMILKSLIDLQLIFIILGADQ